MEGLLISEPLAPPDTGDLHADLATWLSSVFAMLRRPGGEHLIRSLAAAAADNAEVGRRIRDSLGGTSDLAPRLRAAVARGELSSAVPLEEFAEVLVGAVMLRALARADTDRAAAERLISIVLPS
jgi:hypothetical protein